MTARRKQIKPIYAAFMIIFFSGLSIVYFLYGDKIIDQNPGSREKYGAYKEASAVIINRESDGGRRARTVFTIQFRDEEDVLHTSRLYENDLYTAKKGDTITIYYDPKNPKSTVESERVYNEMMKK